MPIYVPWIRSALTVSLTESLVGAGWTSATTLESWTRSDLNAHLRRLLSLGDAEETGLALTDSLHSMEAKSL
jgi:hypothetical protein